MTARTYFGLYRVGDQVDRHRRRTRYEHVFDRPLLRSSGSTSAILRPLFQPVHLDGRAKARAAARDRGADVHAQPPGEPAIASLERSPRRLDKLPAQRGVSDFVVTRSRSSQPRRCSPCCSIFPGTSGCKPTRWSDVGHPQSRRRHHRHLISSAWPSPVKKRPSTFQLWQETRPASRSRTIFVDDGAQRSDAEHVA